MISIILPVHARNQELIDLTFKAVESIQSREELCLQVQLNRLEGMSDEDFEKALGAITGPKGIWLWIDNGPERCVSAAWNAGVKQQLPFGSEFFLLINNDIVLQPDTIDRLVEYGRTAPPDVALWSAANIRDHPDTPDSLIEDGADFSCFMISPHTVEKHGSFDENFMPAYYEDNDAVARIVLAGDRVVKVHAAKYFHHGSMTIRADNEASQGNARTFSKNHAYFCHKWGVPNPANNFDTIRQTYFQHPFDDATKPLSWWPKPTRVDFW